MPLFRNLPNRAGDELAVNAALGKFRQNHPELPIAYERLAADDRHVERTMAIDDVHEFVDQLLALEVADLPQRHPAADVVVAVGVAARAAERTFAGDLDRQNGCVAGEDTSPRRNNAFHIAPLYQRLLGSLRPATA